MITIYERVPKTRENAYGIKELAKEDSLIGKEPCLLCISAQNMYKKSVFGIIREGMQASRIRTTEEIGPGYDIKDFPVHFLGLTFQEDEKYKTPGEELAQEYIIPLIEKVPNEERNTLKNKFRNINVLTFCNGTQTYIELEELVQKRMQELGYDLEEQKDILKQISVTAIETMSDTSNINATCSTFIDVNDTEIWTPLTEKIQKKLDDEQKKIIQIPLSENKRLYYFKGDGTHSIKEYLKDQSLIKVPICAHVVSSLNNSIYNNKENNHTPLMQDDSFYNTLIPQLNNDAIKKEEIVEMFDNNVDYDGVAKKTSETLDTLNELDIAYKMINTLEKDNTYLQESLKESHTSFEKLVNTVEKKVPEDTYYEILVEGTGFQMPIGKEEIKSESKGRK